MQLHNSSKAQITQITHANNALYEIKYSTTFL
jgi:hypothetical protein